MQSCGNTKGNSMWIEDTWFVRFGEYIGYWPGMATIILTYIVGVAMSFSHYKSWPKRALYIVALTVTMAILWTVLQLVVRY
jgi:lipoprotein signal peptidase